MIKTFIFVEDGSVDVQQLQEDVGNDVKVITYRQGSAKPIIEQPTNPVTDCFDVQDTRVFGPTKKALEEVLNSKINKRARKILEELYNNYYCD